MPSIPPEPPNIDLEGDWQALGKPTAAQLAWQEFRANFWKNVMDLVNRFFAWLDGVIKFPFRLIGSVVTWFLDTDNFLRFVGYSVAVACFVMGGWVLREAIRATDVVSHCSISVETPNSGDPSKDIHVLNGHRSWRSDAKIRRSTDFKALQETARELGCPLQ